MLWEPIWDNPIINVWESCFLLDTLYLGDNEGGGWFAGQRGGPLAVVMGHCIRANVRVSYHVGCLPIGF